MNVQVSRASSCVKSLGHLALHYRHKDDGPAATKLLDMLGFARMSSPAGYPFYHYVVDSDHAYIGDGILYVMEQPEALRELNEAIQESLKVGQPGEHPVVAKVKAAQDSDPEYDLHLGVLYESLEAVEDAVLKVQDAIANDPDLRGRAKVILNRARPGNDEVDARMDSSPIFGGVDRYTYGHHGIQAFIETDLFVAGALGNQFVFELDYVFPGHKDNILSNPTGVPLEAH
jgi:hypothetical protein